MITLKLTQGKTAIIDESDEALCVFTWCAHRMGNRYYAHRNCPEKHGKLISMHRTILECMLSRALLPGEEVDHIDHDGLNNSRSNLRLVSRSQNNANQRKRRNCSSRFKGVCWNKQHKKWKVEIAFEYRHMYVGCFDDEVDAARAYDRSAKKIFTTFCNLNFPEADEVI
jgi:hypothetical protein